MGPNNGRGIFPPSSISVVKKLFIGSSLSLFYVF
jgi:hypothetical protein